MQNRAVIQLIVSHQMHACELLEHAMQSAMAEQNYKAVISIAKKYFIKLAKLTQSGKLTEEDSWQRRLTVYSALFTSHGELACENYNKKLFSDAVTHACQALEMLDQFVAVADLNLFIPKINTLYYILCVCHYSFGKGHCLANNLPQAARHYLFAWSIIPKIKPLSSQGIDAVEKLKNKLVLQIVKVYLRLGVNQVNAKQYAVAEDFLIYVINMTEDVREDKHLRSLRNSACKHLVMCCYHLAVSAIDTKNLIEFKKYFDKALFCASLIEPQITEHALMYDILYRGIVMGVLKAIVWSTTKSEMKILCGYCDWAVKASYLIHSSSRADDKLVKCLLRQYSEMLYQLARCYWANNNYMSMTQYCRNALYKLSLLKSLKAKDIAVIYKIYNLLKITSMPYSIMHTLYHVGGQLFSFNDEFNYSAFATLINTFYSQLSVDGFFPMFQDLILLMRLVLLAMASNSLPAESFKIEYTLRNRADDFKSALAFFERRVDYYFDAQQKVAALTEEVALLRQEFMQAKDGQASDRGSPVDSSFFNQSGKRTVMVEDAPRKKQMLAASNMSPNKQALTYSA